VPEEGLAYANQALADLFGYETSEDLRQVEPAALYAEAGRRAQLMEVLRKEGEFQRREVEFRRKDGTRFTGLMSGTTTRNRDGEIQHCDGAVTNITERKERRYRAVFEAPNILVGLLEMGGAVMDINQTAMSYVEPSLERLKGEPFWETPWFAGDPALQEDIGNWIRKAREGEYVEFEADLTEALGEKAVVNGVFRPVVDEEGQATSLLISDRDVTQQKKAKEVLIPFAFRRVAICVGRRFSLSRFPSTHGPPPSGRLARQRE